jgi:hypothetical protein
MTKVIRKVESAVATLESYGMVFTVACDDLEAGKWSMNVTYKTYNGWNCKAEYPKEWIDTEEEIAEFAKRCVAEFLQEYLDPPMVRFESEFVEEEE